MLDLRETSTSTLTAQPRAIGDLVLSSKARGSVSAINVLRASGCLKALFPRRSDAVESILINTSGGLTGGDRLSLAVTAGAGSHLVLTTQAAERGYRAATGLARVTTQLTVEQGARMHWLPQELILYDGARLARRLRADVVGDGRLLLVEPVIFGRHAMGERLRDALLQDRIEIWRDGAPIYCDAVALDGDIETQMARAALGGGAGAMACVVYLGPDAPSRLPAVRADLPETGGASLVRDDLLVARVLAKDGFDLRKTLLPVLDRLSGTGLPTSWRL